MPLRASPEEIIATLPPEQQRAVLPEQLGLASDLANQIVDKVLVGKGLAATLLRHIERLLGGHYVMMTHRAVTEEGAEGMRAKYEVAMATPGFGETGPGRSAIGADVTGTLASLSRENRMNLIADWFTEKDLC